MLKWMNEMKTRNFFRKKKMRMLWNIFGQSLSWQIEGVSVQIVRCTDHYYDEITEEEIDLA
jgi:hypothetical protein